MALLSIDELNTPNVEVEEPEEYFRKMDLTPAQREERVDTSKELASVMLFLFALLVIEMQNESPDYDYVYEVFRVRFRNVVLEHSPDNAYTERYVNDVTRQLFDNTVENMKASGVGKDQTDAGWWSSTDRATAIGENEANSILNYKDLQKAIEEGYVLKRWVTEKDNRVRRTHSEMEGKTIPINDYFIVGDVPMMMPHDPECLDQREIVNCRCSLAYIDKNGKVKK